MSYKTRKHIWPVSLVMSIAIIGALAALLVLAANPGGTQAHPGDEAAHRAHCATLGVIDRAVHDGINSPSGVDCADLTTDPGTGGNGGTTMPEPMAGDVSVTSSSTSGSATVELKLTIKLKEDVPVGGAIVLYLEDDFQEPDSISASDVYFVSMPPANASDEHKLVTGNGSRVYATQNPEIDTDDHFTADKDDIDIRVSVPDMCSNNEAACEGANGLISGDTVTMVIQKSAGIKNPSEAGSHSVGASVLGSTDNVGGPEYRDAMIDGAPLATYAKIGLSDVDNSRGYEMTVTGSGFNDGTTAGAYVLAHARFLVADWWETLDCAGMKAALGTDSDNACLHYDLNEMYKSYSISSDRGHADFLALGADDQKKYSDMVFTQHLCRIIVEGKTFHPTQANGMRASSATRIKGTEVGGALVGSDDKVAVTFEVTVPTFQPGNVNYICMVDGEGRASNRDVEDFNLEPSIAVVPSTASTGDTVNVFAQDYQNNGANFTRLKIGGQTMAPNGASLMTFVTDDENISASGSGSVTFEVPGGFEGTLRVDARWGSPNADGDCNASEGCEDEDGKITLGGAELNSSKTDVLPNETITVNGNGFGSQTCIPEANITLDSVPLMVHEDSVDDDGCVEVSNSGQFVATLILWPADGGDDTNPALIPGTHTLEITDDEEYGSSISLTIAEPSITVTPDIAGPRDYITVTGEAWAVDNLDNSLSDPISVVIEDYSNGRTYPVYADSVGRFTVEHRVHRRVAIPDTVQVKANYDNGRVVQIGSFGVPASTITVTPGEGQPGDTVTLTSANMPVYTEADYVEIGGTTYTDPGVNTDRDGNITIEDVLIPGLDPGIYSVVINVDNTIAIGEVNVLAESSAAGAPAALPGAVENLGDNLVAIFHFDDVGKTWSFYDPRPEFADLNTLTEMVNGEAYWILVSETVEDVVLNNKVRSLTCRGDDCWNLEVW